MNKSAKPVTFVSPTIKAKLASHFGSKRYRINVSGDIFVFKVEPAPSRVQGWIPFGNVKNADVRRKVAGL